MMTGLRCYRWVLVMASLLAVGMLAGCKPVDEPLEAQAEATIAGPLPTALGVASPTPLPGAATPDPALEGLPGDLSGYELLAARLGAGVYTGYLCTIIAEPGCVCDQAVIQRVTFTFLPGDQMVYSFSGAGYSAEWPMTRVGVNQWGYTFRQGVSESGDTQGGSPGDYSYLLEFLEDGYMLTQGANVGTAFVSCPTITFRRLSSSTPSP